MYFEELSVKILAKGWYYIIFLILLYPCIKVLKLIIMNRYIFNEWLNRRNVLVIPLLWVGAALTSAQVGLNCLYSFLLMVLAVYVASKDGIWLKSDNSEVRNVFQVAMYSTFDKKELAVEYGTFTVNYVSFLDGFCVKKFKNNEI